MSWILKNNQSITDIKYKMIGAVRYMRENTENVTATGDHDVDFIYVDTDSIKSIEESEGKHDSI